jgi:hypothetical protein
VSPIAVFLASIISSGAVAALISSSLSDAKERRILRRQKIEEIYLNAAAWLRSAEGAFLPYLRVCEGVLTYNQVLDLEIKKGPRGEGEQHLRMKMNIEMYERGLIPALRLMEEELQKLGRIKGAIRDCFNETAQAGEFVDLYRGQLLAFGAAGRALEEAIIERGVEIGGEGGLASLLATSSRARRRSQGE